MADDAANSRVHDADAFLAVRPNLLRYAAGALGSAADAEDVVQEVWIRWRQHRWEITSERAWLHTVTRNLTLDRLRERRHRADLTLDQIPAPTPSGAESVIRPEAKDDLVPGVRVMLRALSPLERVVLVLQDGLAWSYADIARLLDRSEPAVRQLRHRARAGLTADRRRYATSRRQVDAVAEAYLDVCAGGDVSPLLAVLAPGVAVVPSGRRRVDDRLVHDVAGIALVREDRLLLCHRRPGLAWYPDVWDVPGSHLLVGERPVACAVRAARKELGVSTVDPEPLAEFTGDDFTLLMVRATDWDGEPRNVMPAEHDAVAFFTRDQAARLPLASRRYLELFDRLPSR